MSAFPSLGQGLRRAARVNPHGLATVDGARERTWPHVAERVAKLAGALRRLGMVPGGRVAVLGYNHDWHLETCYAAAWAGGVVVPLNIRLAPAEVAEQLADAEPAALVLDADLAAQFAEVAAASTCPVVLAGAGGPSWRGLRYEALLGEATPIPDAGKGDDVAAILYTGGTTGRPKGVMLTHANLIANALTLLAALNRGEPWVYLHAAPMFHVADFQFNSAVTLLAGTHAFISKFTPEGVLRAVAARRVTHLCLVPTMIHMLLGADAARHDLGSLKRIHYGGSPMPVSLATRAQARFPSVAFSQGYGQTESAPNLTLLLEDRHVLEGPAAGKLGSAGQAVGTMELEIMGTGGEASPPHAVGEIVARGPHVMAGYWHRPEETAQALRGGWLHTGDAGYRDEDGFIYVVDRLKDMIVSGGENVYSAEVEGALYRHPAVAACAVFGIPDEVWGEAVHAVVALKEGCAATAQELLEHCRAHIAGFKCPRSLDIRPEGLPLTGAGKIMKATLRAPYWQGRTRRVG